VLVYVIGFGIDYDYDYDDIDGKFVRESWTSNPFIGLDPGGTGELDFR
jgi:hypothetical protein